MQFRIADSFTKALGKLNAQEQSAAKITVFDLQQDPSAPGLKFHRIEKSKDSNFWSIRASGDIRVIIHKTAASFLICYVGHHDDAYRWAERRRIEAEGEAAAIFARLDAKARGEFEVLAKKGEGLGHIVSNCGSPQAAFQLLMLEELEHLSETAAKAISNIKFDKVIVWDGGGGNGTGGTAGFLQSLAGSLPPVMKIMKDIGGIEMPDYFGKMVEDSQDSDKEIKTSRPSPPKRGREGARRAARNKPTAPPKNDPSDRSNREDPPGNTPNS